MLLFDSTPLICGKQYNRFACFFVFALMMTAIVAVDGIAAPDQGSAPNRSIMLSAESATSPVGSPLMMTAAVTIDGVAAPGHNVVFTWKLKDDSQPPQTGKTSTTNAKGKTTYRLENVGGRPRTITVEAMLESFPSVTATADVRFELPDGFIALADRLMTLSAAQAYCREQGGKLPRLNDSGSLPQAGSDQITRIDGFGAPDAPWPSGLPLDRYWTGTEFTDPTSPGGGSWLVGIRSGRVLVHNEGKSVTHRVVCVP